MGGWLQRGHRVLVERFARRLRPLPPPEAPGASTPAAGAASEAGLRESPLPPSTSADARVRALLGTLEAAPSVKVPCFDRPGDCGSDDLLRQPTSAQAEWVAENLRLSAADNVDARNNLGVASAWLYDWEVAEREFRLAADTGRGEQRPRAIRNLERMRAARAAARGEVADK